MNIVMERYHDFCEYYMYKTMPEHTFYVVDNGVEPKGRIFPSNAIITSWDKIPWDIIDCGYAVGYERVESVWKHNKPCVFHIDQVPQQWDDTKKLAELLKDTPTCYWSEEEAEMWKVGTPIVRPHPIDTDIFKGYKPTKEMAITIATRAFSGWGPDLKGFNILKDAYPEVPIQVIAKDDHDFANAKVILSEEEMVKTLQDHQVYFNCAWKLDRSPLEAMAVGMPVIALRTGQNVYKKYFNEENNNIIYVWNTHDMITKTKQLLADKELCNIIGSNARETIRKYWDPKLSRKGWNKAFNLAIKNYDKSNLS
jgi:hypothetical protein